MIRGRNGDQWKRAFHTVPWISYTEALCWIFYRDAEAIAALDMMASDRDFAEIGSGMAEAMVSLSDESGTWSEVGPELLLADALEAGTVRATGQLFVLVHSYSSSRYNLGRRNDIDRDKWLDYRLYDAPDPFDKATTAYPKRILHGVPADTGYTNILFSRPDLTSAFPGTGANQIVELATERAERAWTARDGTEATKRLTALFTANPSERSMTNADLRTWLKAQMGRPIGRNAFDRAKEAAITATGAEAWRKPGRPRD